MTTSENTDKNKIVFFHLYMYHGGGERVMTDLMRGFVEDGYGVDLILMQKKGRYIHDLHPDIRVIDLNTKRMIKTLPLLVKYLRKERPYALFAITKHTHLIAIWAKMLARVPTKIVLRIGIPFSIHFKKGLNLRELVVPYLIRVFYPKADRIIAVSAGVADDVAGIIGVSREDISVIHNPKYLAEITSKSKEEVRHPWFLEKKTPIIISMGRLSPQKDFPTLIRAFAKAREQFPARLIIFGSGGERDSLHELIRELGLDKDASIAGFAENPYAYLARSDIFVSSSLWEGMPNVILEAMAVGLPIVATDCNSGPREILAPKSDIRERIREGVEHANFGILVPAGNTEKLSEAIQILLKDGALRKEYSRKSSERIQDFDIKKILGEYKRVIE